MASTFAPGPRMRTLLLMESSPLVSVIEPETMFEKMMVLPPPNPALSEIACRNEPAPLLAVLYTTRLVAGALVAASSARTRKVAGRRGDVFMAWTTCVFCETAFNGLMLRYGALGSIAARAGFCTGKRPVAGRGT